ncbi:MAG TPA: response regulator transcription factor [Stellaceae bacterium]|nr:response regulator transcription factor [Stellaceae bacterium]
MHNRRRILVVGANRALRRSLAEQLELNDEFTAVECDSAAAALHAVQQQRFDAVLLDVGLPDVDGRRLCREIRGAAVGVPIVVLAEAADDSETVLALDAGATDYVTKPFRINVLLARLRAHLRQSEFSDDAVLTIGPYAFRPGAKLLSDANGRRKVRLTEKETAILKFLYRAGRTIGRDMLLGEIWGYSAEVTTHTLETHVYRLRRKIERNPAKAEILVTEPGGYRLLR